MTQRETPGEQGLGGAGPLAGLPCWPWAPDKNSPGLREHELTLGPRVPVWALCSPLCDHGQDPACSGLQHSLLCAEGYWSP